MGLGIHILNILFLIFQGNEKSHDENGGAINLVVWLYSIWGTRGEARIVYDFITKYIFPCLFIRC
jgi:hypothetical protein